MARPALDPKKKKTERVQVPISPEFQKELELFQSETNKSPTLIARKALEEAVNEWKAKREQNTPTPALALF